MNRISSCALLAALAAACGGPQTPESPASRPPTADAPSRPAAAAATSTAAAPVPPGLRLGTHVQPTRYAIDLTVVPTQDTFSGKVVIALALDQATTAIWLHGDHLVIDGSSVSAGGRTIGARVIPATPATSDATVIGFALDRAIGPGAAELAIEFHAALSATESAGLYREDDRGEWYAFTQFEATSARRAFPCFDEPSFKVPFQVALHVKAEHVAVSNAPMVSEAPEGNGMKVVRFAETRPLPTYLVAFAAGPFEIVDGGKAGRNHTPLRIIVPKGHRDEAGFASLATVEVVTRLEDYFGIPYPYDKLDQIAVPRKGGAMENAGLITYGSPLILIPRAEETVARKRRFAFVAAHEIAHHWFGDLVTMAWWDDIWLNEAFASWIEDVIVGRWQPSWNTAVGVVQDRSNAMRGDTLTTARRIRQPIESKHDISSAFDNITYGKGSAVIAMFEHWVGPEKFQRAIRAYIAAHANGVGTTAEFVAAVSAEAGRDVAPVFSTFLDQVGVPLVSVELACGKDQPPKLALSQQRYTAIGARGQAAQTWDIPICVKYGTGDKVTGHACTLLAQPHGELALDTKQCPGWVLANDREVGYYRTRYGGDLLDKLLAAGPKLLTLPERVGILGDLAALVDAGELPLDKVLPRLAALARDPDRHITRETGQLVGLLNDNVVAKALRPNRARFVRRLFGDRARAIGWTSAKGEDDDQRLLRPTLLTLAGFAGEDPGIIAQARRLTDKWLADKRAIDPDLVNLALELAAKHGDRALFDRLHAAARAERERKQRLQILDAMSSFRDPEIVKAAMAIALTDELDPREAIWLVGGPFDSDETRELGWAFVKQHLEALLARLPRDSGARFVGFAGSFCDEAHRADVEAFFKDKAPSYLGGPRSLAQTLERIEVCTARKHAYEASAAAFLAKW